MNTYIITQRRKNMNNKKKNTMFSVEALDDGSGLSVNSHGHPVAVGMMVAIGLAQYFGQEDTVLSMDEFINVLKKAYEDSDFFKLMVSAASLYADDNVDGLKAFAVLTAEANVARLTDGKEKEKDEKGGPVA